MFYAQDALSHSFLHLCLQKYTWYLMEICLGYLRRYWDSKMATRVRDSRHRFCPANDEFPANFMRASRAPPLTNDTPWFSICSDPGGYDDVSFRRRLSLFILSFSLSFSPALLPRTITVFLPFLLSSRGQPSLCAPAVFARLIFQIPWNHRQFYPSV